MKKRYILFALVLIIIGVSVYLSTYNLNTLYISGCNVIDEVTIREMISDKKVMNNTLLTYGKLKVAKYDDIPFLDKIDFEVGSKHQINVIVYEKRIAGCTEFGGYYVYFDKDGVVMEASEKLVPGLPCIKNLDFADWEMGEKLPIDDERKFQLILSITQLVEKYKLDIENVEFTADNEIILTHDNIRIELGEGEYLAIQLMNLGSILDGLEGLSGTLYMKDFDSDNATASFSKK